MKMKILLVAAVLYNSYLFAQADSSNVLNEVVVTATKFPIKQNLTGKVVTVIDQARLQQNSGKSLTDILNLQAGLIVNGSTNVAGTNQDVYLRGAAAGKTLILLDGIPMYDAGGISGAYDLNLVNIDQVERIEILKGSQSTLYGSDAIAGVINIITKTGVAKKVSVNANLSAGSYGTFRTTLGLNGQVNKTNYNLQYSKLYSNGFSAARDTGNIGNFDNDGMNEDVLRANISQKINNRLGMRFTAQLSRYKTDADAGPFKDDADYSVKNKNAIFGFETDYKLAKTTIHFNYSFNNINRLYLDDSASRGGFSYFSKGDYTGKSHFMEVYSNISLSNKIDLLLGADYRNQRTNQSYFSVSSYGPYNSTPLSDDSAKVNQLGAYVSVVVKNVSGFNLELGGRYNRFNRYGNVFTFSFNPSYVIHNSVKFFANISSGFKAPSLYQVYSEYRNPVTELKPEKALSAEAGIQYYQKNMNLRAVYFSRNITDNIVFYSAGPPSYASYYVNADKQKDLGLEVEASVKVGRVQLDVNYVNLDGKIETKAGAKDTAFFNLYRRPRQTFNTNLGINLGKTWMLSLYLQALGKRYEAVYGAVPLKMPAYYTLNFSSTCVINKNIRAFMELRNFTNQKYSEVNGYNSRRFNVLAGVSISY